MILVDTSVLLDLLQNDPVWGGWSVGALASAGLRDELAINEIVFAELSARYDTVAEVDKVVSELGLSFLSTPKQALFLAGRAFRDYRRQGGTKSGVLSDFFIGAHAVVEDAMLLTRDTRRIRSYFPAVTFIAP